MNAEEIIKNPVSTEKAVRLMESNNTITFIVNEKSNKNQIKKAVEKLFKVNVEKVRIVNEGKKKKAYVVLGKDSNALDVATELGMV